MKSTLRLILSGIVAFVFYFAWAYWANSGPNIDPSMTLQSALVQGAYSGLVTLFFTLMLEYSNKRIANKCLALTFMVPVLCAVHSPTRQASAMRQAMNHALDYSAQKAAGSCLPGVMFAPILPITVQSLFVIGVNVLNHTPNLWLTVAPSILFSAIYAYTYSITLWKNRKVAVPAETLIE
ncbi:hypothetical protein QTP81_13750 [Alteromonas sp. ASW11-36]|uniref:Uncharacterized protein n=1 Tax=Alteromonas arenosi TaxID=3055817 RepID=A0ABT7SZT0_9ALTE|nr:hypothetical protein [Alteromonas sp. ASW11-36]MDM7861660.1 hypothetical protein [Alteromonas sp. ASW11-36]